MANLRALVKRRKAIRNIRKITRTMELIATARFKKALDRATEADAYTRKIAELAADLSQNAGEVSHPLLAARPSVKKVLMLVLTSNRGLCGGYNGGILREAMGRVRELRAENTPFDLEASGKRGITYFRFQRVETTQQYTQFDDKPSFEEVDRIATRYIDLFVSGQVDQVQVVYTKFVNAARQVPVLETLLPLSSVSVETRKGGGAAASGKVEYEFLPSAAEILNELVPVAFKVRLFKCFLDAAVSEQIARRVAMKAATENAGDLIKSVTRVYNRTRQANITKEISELIGGAEALEMTVARRQLKLDSLDEMIAEVERLQSGGYEKAGTWDLAQVCDHLRAWLTYPIEGFPKAPLPIAVMLRLVRATLGRGMLEKYLREGMPAGKPTMPQSVAAPGGDPVAAVARLKDAIVRFKAHTGDYLPSPLFGKLTRDEALKLQLAHAEHHLSFLVPKS